MDPHPLPKLPLVLVFAASDPTGGAGLQADLLTLAANGCHPLSVVTALTVQDSVGVKSVLAVDARWVEEQTRTLLREMPVAAFKLGVIGSVENMAAIIAILAEHPRIPLVLDPVLASGRGDELASAEMLALLRRQLLPRTQILTPNTLEAQRLATADGETMPATLDVCAQKLLDHGCEYVLLTGTHSESDAVVNRLYGRPDCLLRSDHWPRLPGSYHGSGCTLAAAVAAFVARGFAVEQAVWAAQEYTWQALAAGFRPAAGQYLPDRCFRLNGQNPRRDG